MDVFQTDSNIYIRSITTEAQARVLLEFTWSKVMRTVQKMLSFVTLFALLFSTSYPICMASSLSMASAPLSIIQDAFALPDAKVGTEYNYQFQSEGGLAPLTWKLIEGQLPSGLKLESFGKLHGIPAQSQREPYEFVIEVSDSSRTPQRFSQPFLVTVLASPLRIVTNQNRLRILTTPAEQLSNGSSRDGTPPSAEETGNILKSKSDNLRASLEEGITESIASSSSSSRKAAARAPEIVSETTPKSAPLEDSTTAPAQICGRLRPSSLDEVLALIVSLPSVRKAVTEAKAKKTADEANKSARLAAAVSEIARKRYEKVQGKSSECNYLNAPDYIVALLNRVNESRFNKDSTCDENETVESGGQKEAVVELLAWLLDKMKCSDWQAETKVAFGEKSSALSEERIRRQILLLNEYLGNVTVQVEDKDGNPKASAVTDRDGNFKLMMAPVATENPYTISTEGDNNYTKRSLALRAGDNIKINIPIEDRPVSLLARAVVGYQQAGAASTDFEQNYFFDLFLSKSMPFRQPINPDFGERLKIWGAIRAISVPTPDTVTIGGLTSSFATQISELKARDAARVFDYLGGIEIRVGGNNSLLPSFDRQTKQKFSLSLIGGFGFITPTNPLQEPPKVYDITAQLKQALVDQGLLEKNPADPAKVPKYATFVLNDRDRFFRQYYGGIRVQTFFFNRYNVPMQRFPAQFDFTVGKNEYVTGGRFKGGTVLRLDGYFPLPYEGLKFINLFGTAVFRPIRATEKTPLILRETAPTTQNGQTVTIKPSDDGVLIVPVSQFNRDYYRVGIGIDFLSFVQKLLNRN